MPSLMAMSRVKLSSSGSVPVVCLHEREWASIGGAGSEAYGDMIVEMATLMANGQFILISCLFIVKFCCQAMAGIQYN